eukprot:5300352-Amphidinium_carterae.1
MRSSKAGGDPPPGGRWCQPGAAKGPLNTGHGKRKQHRRFCAALRDALCRCEDTWLLFRLTFRILHRLLAAVPTALLR